MMWRNRKGKFNASRCTCANGHLHDSGLESRRCDYLHLLMRGDEEIYGGRLDAIEVQPTIELRVNRVLICKYRPDFALAMRWEKQPIYEDVKGIETAVFRLKRRLYDALHPKNPLRVVKRAGRAWIQV